MSPATPRPIHIWLPALADSTGGIQAYLQTFLEAYTAALPDANTRVFIKNDRCEQIKLSGTNLPCRGFARWPVGPLRTLAFAVGLLWAAWRQRPGVIIVGHINFIQLAAWAQRLWGIPFWGIVYGIDVTWAQGAIKASRLAQAERIISISRYTRDCLIEAHGLPPGRFSILPTTFDEQRFQCGPKPEGLAERFGLPPDRRVILTICRLERTEGYKGYDQLLRALPAVLRQVPTAHYLLGGRGNDLPRIRRLVEELNLEKSVTLAGFVPEEELVAFYQLCDVFAMPSRKEGFGIVFLEALACGRPVLAGNRDGSVDALLDGELGLLVDPEDTEAIASALAELLTGEHPHPLVYQPQELRRRVIAAYGSTHFKSVLAEIFRHYLPANVTKL